MSCHLPWPPVSGGRRRELELIKRVARRFDVHLLVVSKTSAQDRSNARELAPWCRRVEVFEAIAYPVADSSLDQPPQVLRHHCPAAADRVREILASEAVDLVHVEGFYLMQHVPTLITAPLLLVEQNVEYELEHQRAQTTAGAAPAQVDMLTQQVEQQAWQRATQLAAVTPEDRLTIERAMPGARVNVVPDGCDHLPHLRVVSGDDRAIRRSASPLLMFVANFAYAPNVDAARHFCLRILPSIQAQIPDVTVSLVGNGPPPEVKELAQGPVTVTGLVADVLPYLDAADLIVCPLRIGGGIKVKAIEALRRGKAIVSTSIGAQGLPQAARDALVIADEPAAFAGAVTSLLQDPGRRAEIARRAARAARQLPTWDDAARALVDLYDRMLAEQLQPRRGPAGHAAAGGRR